MPNLIDNLDKLHTTTLGAERIKHNLNLQTQDVVQWCKAAVEQADIIIGQGKNWYVYFKGTVITVNAHSYTIITSHPIKPKIRAMLMSDYECLAEFCYQAIFIPEGAEPPPRSVVKGADIYIYIDDFGSRIGDYGVVAEQNGLIIGAAWTRIIPSYGNVDSKTPELAVSILPEFRGYGIGAKLMRKLFKVLFDNGYSQTSLSVQKKNPAVRFYKRLGYKIVKENHDDYIMILNLKELFHEDNTDN